MNRWKQERNPKSELEKELEDLRDLNLKLSFALREAKELVSIAPAFFGFISPTGEVREVNDLALQAIGARSEEVIGELFWECPWWKPLPRSRTRVQEVVQLGAKGQSSQLEIEFWTSLRIDGRKSWVQLSIIPFKDERGRVTRMAATGIDISDQRVAQEALRVSEEQLSRAIGVSKVGFYDWDIVCDRITFSSQMKLDWGIEAGTSIEDCLERVHPLDRQRVARAVEQTMVSGNAYFAEYRVIRPDGNIIWIEAQGEVLFDEGKRPVRFFGTSINITDRKKIETRLAAERHKFEAIFVDSPAAMGLFRGDSLIVEKVNPPYQALFEGRQLLGKALEEAQPELVGQPFVAWMKEVFATGNPFIGREILTRLMRHPGTPLEDMYFDLTYTRISDGEGNPYGIYVHAIDVTGKVLARRQIEKSEAKFRQLADAMPQIVWAARPDGCVDYYNRRWYDFTGAKLGSGDESWMPILHSEDVHPCRERWYRSVKTGEPYQMEHRFKDQKNGGYRWYLGRAVPIRDEQGNIIRWFGTATDIHDKKLTEEELTQSNSELARFAFVASHDLKEPLRVVSNYVQMLKMQYQDKLDGTADRYIDFVVSGVKRMYELINDVLCFSRIDASPADFKGADINEILKEVLSNLETSIKESRAEVICRPLPYLVVEGGQIIQLLQNLLSNALKYRDPNRSPKIEISATKKHTDWIFSVRDNGIGIESQYLEKIFVLFERLHGKEDYCGTGIGLAICKKIVERHRGKIWAESTVGEGSTFFFQIPAGVENTL